MVVGRGEVGIKHVINQTIMLARPACYKNFKLQTFENNSDRFGTDLDLFIGVFRFPSENNNES